MKATILLLLSVTLISCKVDKVTPPAAKPDSIQLSTMENPKPTSEQHTIEYCMGKFDPKADDRFVTIDGKYADREGMLLRAEAYQSFLEMYKAAANDGVKLTIRSATRNFDYQKGIWERKWTGKTTLSDGVNAAKLPPVKRAAKIMNYSAMPGASRHHWGTDIDLNSFNNNYFESGEGLKVYQWLSKYAHTYGYCQPYTPKSDGRSGYNEEKWHWSYTPLSESMTLYVAEHMKDEDLKGFSGHEAAGRLSVVQTYILGIDHSCYPSRSE